jgi:hypothetical protein
MGIFLFTTASRPALDPTQPPIQLVPGALSLGVKRPGREADLSPTSTAEVKNAWSYASIPPLHLHGMVLSYSSMNGKFISGLFRDTTLQNRYVAKEEALPSIKGPQLVAPPHLTTFSKLL